MNHDLQTILLDGLALPFIVLTLLVICIPSVIACVIVERWHGVRP